MTSKVVAMKIVALNIHLPRKQTKSPPRMSMDAQSQVFSSKKSQIALKSNDAQAGTPSKVVW